MTSQNRRPTMKDNQAKYPQLRFKGYSDAWVQRKLGENATILTGGTPKTTEPSYWEPKEIPWMSSGEVNKKRLESTDNMISEIGLENSSARWVKEHSILIALAGQGKTRGMVAINNIPLTTNQSIAAIEPNESLDYEFVFQNLGNRYDELRMSSSGDGTRGGLNKKIISDILVSAPDIDEQKQIGKLFASLDNLIAANQRKLDLLKEQKKGYLQKMFPKNGAKVPELRFAGFADAWEQRKLGDVVGEIQSGNRLPKDSLTSGNIPYVVAQTKNEGVFKTISKKTLDYNGNPMKLFPGNSISFSIDNPKAMFYRSTEFYTSNIMRVIHADYLSHQQYLFILENMKSFTRRYDWSRKFSGPVVSNLEYLQPNEQEQCKIGSFILAFDNIITLHQRKLEKLQELKKGYLQKMFC